MTAPTAVMLAPSRLLESEKCETSGASEVYTNSRAQVHVSPRRPVTCPVWRHIRSCALIVNGAVEEISTLLNGCQARFSRF